MDGRNQNFGSLSIKQLVYALAAADAGNVTAAARTLNISQPAVSAAIAALEQHYGQTLFVRMRGQGVALTSFGITVMKEARTLCDQMARVAALARSDDALTGEVTLCIYDVLAPYILPNVLTRLRRVLPQVDVRFLEADLDGVTEAIRRGTADLAITYDLGLESTMSTETLYELQPKILCARTHPFAERKRIALSELHRQKLILLDQPMSAHYVLGLLKAHKAEPVIEARVQGFELQRSLVANGFGLALTHTIPQTPNAYDGSEVCTLPISDDLPEQRVLMAWNAQNRDRPVLKATQVEVLACFRPD